jgi:hypothetical protein
MTLQPLNRQSKLFLMCIAVVVCAFVILANIQVAQAQAIIDFYPLSPLRTLIPANATYTAETRIGSLRQSAQDYECPVTRTPATPRPALVTVSNPYGRVETWPIPRSATPALGEDGHMCVVDTTTGMVYEFYQAVWTSNTTISAGGMVAFPLNSTGVSNPTNRRVTASGFANTIGQIKREDFTVNGQLTTTNVVIRHALTMALPFALVEPNSFVAPAVGGADNGLATSNGIPLGARFALPKTLNIDALSVDPVVKATLKAVRDYGVYVSDTSGDTTYNGKATGILEVEPGLLPLLYGSGANNDTFRDTVQSQIYTVINQYGLFRVTGGTILPTATFTRTPMPVPPTATFTRTPMPVPPTATFTRTNTPVPPTATFTRTNTPIAPTATFTRTNTPVPPTATFTRTNTPIAPTATFTRTNTPVPPTATFTRTNTPVPPTATFTRTNTPIAPTATFTRTNTPIAPTATFTRTNTPMPPTATFTPVPPTATVPSGVLGSRIVVPVNILVNTTFSVAITLDNPALATGGGVRRMITECTLTPESRLIGSNAVAGTVFGPSPAIINRNFQYSDYLYFSIAQSGSNPPVRVGGNVLTFNIRPTSTGSGTITCSTQITTASNTTQTLTVVPVTFTVR